MRWPFRFALYAVPQNLVWCRGSSFERAASNHLIRGESANASMYSGNGVVFLTRVSKRCGSGCGRAQAGYAPIPPEPVHNDEPNGEIGGAAKNIVRNTPWCTVCVEQLADFQPHDVEAEQAQSQSDYGQEILRDRL